MSTIRPLERDDIPAIADLHAQSSEPPTASRREVFASFFARTLLESPWADPDIPSLVAIEGNAVVGFLGSHARRMQLDGRPIRMGCCAHLLTHPRTRSKGYGGLLLRAYLNGPQDLSITDGATREVQAIWERIGGVAVHPSGLAWVRVLRPAGLMAHRLSYRRGGGRAPVAARPLTGAADVLAGLVLREPAPRAGISTEPLSPEVLLEQLPVVTAGLRLVPRWDLPYLQWLFEELDRVGRDAVFPAVVPRGRLVAQLVRDEGRVLGWYLAHTRRHGMCRVLQIAAPARNAGAVLDCVTMHARSAGATGVYGRLEHRLVAPLSSRRSMIRFADGRMLAHARDEDILHAILKGDALLTRMEGEWW